MRLVARLGKEILLGPLPVMEAQMYNLVEGMVGGTVDWLASATDQQPPRNRSKN